MENIEPQSTNPELTWEEEREIRLAGKTLKQLGAEIYDLLDAAVRSGIELDWIGVDGIINGWFEKVDKEFTGARFQAITPESSMDQRRRLKAHYRNKYKVMKRQWDPTVERYVEEGPFGDPN
jgi:hypothetical protein